MLDLGGKGFCRVLSRISTALAKFIKPVSTPDPASRGFEKFQTPKKEEKQEQSRSAKIIPFPEKKTAPAVAQSKGDTGNVGVTHSFLQLFTLLQGQRGRMMNWLGGRTYRNAATQGRKRLLKKGAMLDQKAE